MKKNNKKGNKTAKQKVQNKLEEKLKDENQIEGRNSVLELLETGKDINKIFITKGEKHG